jgi:hypothetical protein
MGNVIWPLWTYGEFAVYERKRPDGAPRYLVMSDGSWLKDFRRKDAAREWARLNAAGPNADKKPTI